MSEAEMIDETVQDECPDTGGDPGPGTEGNGRPTREWGMATYDLLDIRQQYQHNSVVKSTGGVDPTSTGDGDVPLGLIHHGGYIFLGTEDVMANDSLQIAVPFGCIIDSVMLLTPLTGTAPVVSVGLPATLSGEPFVPLVTNADATTKGPLAMTDIHLEPLTETRVLEANFGALETAEPAAIAVHVIPFLHKWS